MVYEYPAFEPLKSPAGVKVTLPSPWFEADPLVAANTLITVRGSLSISVLITAGLFIQSCEKKPQELPQKNFPTYKGPGNDSNKQNEPKKKYIAPVIDAIDLLSGKEKAVKDLEEWCTLGPETASVWVEKLNDYAKILPVFSLARDKVLEKLVEKWGYSDPAAALKWMNSLGFKMTTAWTVFAQAIVKKGATEGKRYLRRYDVNCGGGDAPLKVFIIALAKENPKDAATWIEAYKGSFMQEVNLYDENWVIAGRALADLEKTADWVVENKVGYKAVAEVWSAKDPKEAIAWAKTLPKRKIASAYLGIVNNYSTKDPEAALKWGDEAVSQNIRRASKINKVIKVQAAQALINKDPQKALELAKNVNNNNRLLNTLAENRAEVNPQHAVEIFTSCQDIIDTSAVQVMILFALKDPAKAMASIPALKCPESLKQDLVSMVAMFWYNVNPAQVEEYVSGKLNAALKDSAVLGYSIQASVTDLAKGDNGLAIIKDSKKKSALIRFLIAQHVKKDPSKAVELTKQSSAFKKEIFDTLASFWYKEDPAKAADWVFSLPEDAKSAKGIVFSNWMKDDSKAAADWMVSKPYSKELDFIIDSLMKTWSSKSIRFLSDFFYKHRNTRTNDIFFGELILHICVDRYEYAEKFFPKIRDEKKRLEYVYKTADKMSLANDPRPAVNLILERADSDKEFIWKILKRWVFDGEDIQSATTWAFALPKPETQAFCVKSLAQIITEKEPEAAKLWFTELVKDEKNQILVIPVIAKELMKKNKADAIRWAASLNEKNKKLAMQTINAGQ